MTEIRNNIGMPSPKDMPDDLDTIGKRVRWWRDRRGLDRKTLAQRCRMSVTALSDLELDRTKKGSYLHLIAAELRLNSYYLQTGKGEPEAGYAQEPPQEPAEWPFSSVPRSKLSKLNNIERTYAETKLLEALQEIEAERRKSKKLS